MTSSDPRIDAILASPPELSALTRWLDAERRASGPDAERRDYLFLEGRPRFEPRKEDVAVTLPGITVGGRGDAAVVVAPVAGAPSAQLAVPGVSARAAERFLAAIDGRRTLLEARWHAEVATDVAARVLRATFGLVVLAPAAVGALEARVPSVEIVRYPTSPYAVERTYWDNAGDVRQRAEEARDRLLGDVDDFTAALRELHVVQILGAGLDRFYRPASPSTDVGVDPGALHHAASRVLSRDDGPSVFLDGIRVLAPAVGGRRAFAELALGVGDPDAISSAREIVDADLPWGRVGLLRGDGDDVAKAWFVPPRPMLSGHWAALQDALRTALCATDPDDVVAAAARFHARFVRLHPFRCANQSIAMALANSAVARVKGAGIPHLALDHVALRMAPAAYERVFRRAVDAFADGSSERAARLTQARTRSRAALALGDQLDACRDDDAARAVIEARPDAARWALLR